MQKSHLPLVASGYSLKLAACVMSWDATTPPSAVGLAHADTVKSFAGFTAAALVARALLVPSKNTSGLNRSPVFQVAFPDPVAGSPGGPVTSAAVAAAPLLPSLSSQAWVA